MKSVYDKAASSDGKRYLTDLFWPEGVHTRLARVDEWLKELGPSYDLLRFEWNRNDWSDYERRYRQELLQDHAKKAMLKQLAQEARDRDITLLYSAGDTEHNHALVLKELIESQVI